MAFNSSQTPFSGSLPPDYVRASPRFRAIHELGRNTPALVTPAYRFVSYLRTHARSTRAFAPPTSTYVRPGSTTGPHSLPRPTTSKAGRRPRCAEVAGRGSLPWCSRKSRSVRLFEQHRSEQDL